MKSLTHFKVIFWDFDGVIKDSVDVKTRAFANLFMTFGPNVVEKVVKHHEAHGGVSRYEKIPLYLTWAGVNMTEQLIDKYCERFSNQVLQAVIDAPWVAGVHDYLIQQHQKQYFVLVTATPQEEIDVIIEQLGIRPFFCKVFGAPKDKSKAIRLVMNELKIPSDHALMIGDAASDLQAAKQNGIEFWLRKTKINESLQIQYPGPQFTDFKI